jgi:16S rRNA (guanine527-N7)-methyltransferase
VVAEVKEAEKAVAALGGTVALLQRVAIIPGENDRYLVVMEKVGTTPETYPRRPGIPAKRPLR